MFYWIISDSSEILLGSGLSVPFLAKGKVFLRGFMLFAIEPAARKDPWQKLTDGVNLLGRLSRGAFHPNIHSFGNHRCKPLLASTCGRVVKRGKIKKWIERFLIYQSSVIARMCFETALPQEKRSLICCKNTKIAMLSCWLFLQEG